jgi:uncharacterized protein YfbU (UPF0304 family)
MLLVGAGHPLQKNSLMISKRTVFMKLTNPEKLILLMLSEIYEHLDVKGDSGIDPAFVKEAIHSRNTWGFEWQYPSLFESSGSDSAEVIDVVNTLDMWWFIENSYVHFNAADKEKLKDLSPFYGDNPKFPGFDGNNEGELLSIGRFLTEKLGRFESFKGRINNSHSPTIAGYRRMYEVFEPIRRLLGPRGLTVEEIGKILNARNHPTGD